MTTRHSESWFVFRAPLQLVCSRYPKAAQGNHCLSFVCVVHRSQIWVAAVARTSILQVLQEHFKCLTGKIYGIPCFDYMHLLGNVTFDSELTIPSRAFAKSVQLLCSLLLDTYDVHEGIKNAPSLWQKRWRSAASEINCSY